MPFAKNSSKSPNSPTPFPKNDAFSRTHATNSAFILWITAP